MKVSNFVLTALTLVTVSIPVFNINVQAAPLPNGALIAGQPDSALVQSDISNLYNSLLNIWKEQHENNVSNVDSTLGRINFFRQQLTDGKISRLEAGNEISQIRTEFGDKARQRIAYAKQQMNAEIANLKSKGYTFTKDQVEDIRYSIRRSKQQMSSDIQDLKAMMK